MTERFSPGSSRSPGEPVRLLPGDPCDVLARMPVGSADCVVTSPPGYRLSNWCLPTRSESGPDAYLNRMRSVFREVWRVLVPDGTLWLNLADSYAPGPAGQSRTARFSGRPGAAKILPNPDGLPLGGPLKGSLLGLPWRVALALQADGWILRNAIIWHTPGIAASGGPGPVPCTHEYVFLLVKQAHYWFDLDALREPLRRPAVAAHPPPVGGRKGAAGCLGGSARRRTRRPAERHAKYRPADPQFRCRAHDAHILPTGRQHTAAHPRGRNPGDVWTAPVITLPSSPVIARPDALALRCIAAGCPPGGMVLDPFSGGGITGLAALQLDRCYTGIETSPAQHRLAQMALARAAGRQSRVGTSPAGERDQ